MAGGRRMARKMEAVCAKNGAPQTFRIIPFEIVRYNGRKSLDSVKTLLRLCFWESEGLCKVNQNFANSCQFACETTISL
jgi:hypothetical protein